MEEKKFVCKYCSKRFQCGKSLGGHIRTHMSEERRSNNANAVANANANVECDDDLNKLDDDDDAVRMKKKKRDLWCEAGYGLRENPKKTMRFVHSNVTTNTTAAAALEEQQQHEKFCKECGKGFASLKALCGHMACHSEKNKLVMDMDSESDTDETFDDVPKAPRRSKRMRFKTLSLSNQNGGSSSVSEVEQEQEEVARCLILLSKDSSHKGPFALATESSENNSVVVEEAAKSSPVDDMRIGINKKGNNNFVSNGHGYDLVEKKVLKLKSSDNSDSGYFRHGFKTRMADSDVSNDEFKSEFEDYNVESRKMLNMNKGRSKYTGTLFKKSVKQDLDYDRADGTTRKFDSFGHSKKTGNDFVSDEIYETGEYENLDYDSTEESDENSSSDSDSFPAPKSHSSSKSKVFNGKKSSKAKKKNMKLESKSKKSKEHECPICYKIFKSGQALGGHKRSHFIGGSEENTVVIQQGAPAVPCFIDLNLPAPVDE
ncbi:hypothetical protein RIF29_35550 [Crotalaria pallida]|uniref:C2H2-type domain-containing protein n=1 Tax=Crotalaria pallida TaxID=3830 RepID=A0AAN9HU33_CROPI